MMEVRKGKKDACKDDSEHDARRTWGDADGYAWCFYMRCLRN